MTAFYIYWDKPTKHVRIHRADCRACNYGEGMHGGEIATRRGELHDWIKCTSYRAAVEQAASIAGKMDVAVNDCGLCHPQNSNESRTVDTASQRL